MTKRRDTMTRADASRGVEALGASERYLVPALIRGLSILQDLSGERRRLTLVGSGRLAEGDTLVGLPAPVHPQPSRLRAVRHRDQDLRPRPRSPPPRLRLSRGARSRRSGDAASGAPARPHRLVGASRRIAGARRRLSRARRHAPLDRQHGTCRHAASGARHDDGPHPVVRPVAGRSARALSRRTIFRRRPGLSGRTHRATRGSMRRRASSCRIRATSPASPALPRRSTT